MNHNTDAPSSKAAHKLQETLISGHNCREFYDHIDLLHGVPDLVSPVTPAADFPAQCHQLLKVLFQPGDMICIGEGVYNAKAENALRVTPRKGPMPEGVYFKVNSLVNVNGSGRRGGWADSDCTTKLMMLEIDSGPKEDQLKLWTAAISLGFPAVSLVDSGGKSYHVILRVNCSSMAAYKKVGSKLLNLFGPFILDPVTINCSRFTRLPGCVRGVGDGARQQKLVYLNPDAPVWTGEEPVVGEIAEFTPLAMPVPEWLRSASIRRAKERNSVPETDDAEKKQFLARVAAAGIKAGADLGQLADNMGWTLERLEATDELEEKTFIQCPWHLEHTGGGDADGPTDAYIYRRKSNFSFPWGFHCSHSSCNGVYKAIDVIEKVREEEPAALEMVVTPFCEPLDAFMADDDDEAAPEDDSEEEDVDPGGLNDLDNAATFVRRFKNKVYYLHDVKKWLLWDGKRWKRDELGHINNLADDVAKIRINAAEDLEQKMRAKSAGNIKSITNFLLKASCRPEIAAKSDGFDTDLWSAGTPDGVIDLRTGELRRAKPADRITRALAVRPGGPGECPTFLQCLKDFHPGRPEITAFLKRYFGYCLTGDVSEQKLVIFFGNGRNGKSTLVNTIKAVMGDYSVVAGRSLLVGKQKEDNDAPSPGIMKLKSARFGVVSETEFGVALNESMVKIFTGTDGVDGRGLQEAPQTFYPEVKLLLSSNYKPRIRGTDTGIWRRILLVPFDENFEGRENLALETLLKSEYPGILRWMIEGCLEYQEKGLAIPDSIQKVTKEFREGEDYLGMFISDNLTITKDCGGNVQKGLVYDLYQRWAISNGVRPVQAQALSKSLTERGAKGDRDTTSRFWTNITVMESADLG